MSARTELRHVLACTSLSPLYSASYSQIASVKSKPFGCRSLSSGSYKRNTSTRSFSVTAAKMSTNNDVFLLNNVFNVKDKVRI